MLSGLRTIQLHTIKFTNSSGPHLSGIKINKNFKNRKQYLITFLLFH